MSDMNSIRKDIDGAANALNVSSTLSTSFYTNHQSSSLQQPRSQRTSSIALNRNPSLNSTASSTTHGTSTTRQSKESTTSTSRGTSRASKLSVDEILSSTKYSLDARKRRAWTRDELERATNVRMLKSSLKADSVDPQVRLENMQSPKKYNFPSGNECPRSKESKVVGDLGHKNSPQKEALHRNEARQDSTISEVTTTECHDDDTPKRTSSRLHKNTSQSSLPRKVTPDDLQLDNHSSADKDIQIFANSSPPQKPHRLNTLPTAEAVSQLIEKYTSCLHKKEPTPWDVVQLFCPLLEYIEFSSHRDNTVQNQDGDVVIKGLGQIVKSVKNVKLDVLNRGFTVSQGNTEDSRKDESSLSLEEKLLRTLQIQIWIRIMVWNFCREDGWVVLRRVLELHGVNEGHDEKVGRT